MSLETPETAEVNPNETPAAIAPAAEAGLPVPGGMPKEAPRKRYAPPLGSARDALHASIRETLIRMNMIFHGMRRLPAVLITSLCLLALPTLAQTQPVAAGLPANAVAKSYGVGWTCNKGYRESNGSCAAVKPPANAHLTGGTYGAGWDCDYGFDRVGDLCAAVPVPVNAYLDGSGTRWDCERGYVRDGQLCKAIKVPVNGYLTNSNYGSGWACERGFRPERGTCAKIVLPAKAYLTDSATGAGWACERGYLVQAGACTKVIVPKFAHLNSSGDGWQCNRPYRQVGNTCATP